MLESFGGVPGGEERAELEASIKGEFMGAAFHRAALAAKKMSTREVEHAAELAELRAQMTARLDEADSLSLAELARAGVVISLLHSELTASDVSLNRVTASRDEMAAQIAEAARRPERRTPSPLIVADTASIDRAREADERAAAAAAHLEAREAEMTRVMSRPLTPP